jgi:hypothetical protein
MNVRPIDANAFNNHVALYMAENAYLNDTALDVLKKISKWLEEEPTLDYAPVVHGEWIECDWVEYDNHDECVHYPKQGLKCTACFNVFKKQLLWKRNYCPNCGAKMDGGK